MQIVTREQWGARYSAGFGATGIASEVWLHHSAGLAPDLTFTDLNRDSVDDDEAAVMRALENIGQQRFNGGISYTFIVMPSGRVYEGTGPKRRGAHTAKRNSFASAICLPGNYETRRPTEAQVNAVAGLLRHGVTQGWWKQARLTGGHRDAPGAQTACPGRYAHAAIPTINARASTGAPEEDDDVTPEQWREIQYQGDQLRSIANLVVSQVDGIPTAVWRHPVYRGGKPVAALQELADAKSALAASAGREAALLAAIKALGAGTIDLDAVTSAAEQGVRAALEGARVTIEPKES